MKRFVAVAAVLVIAAACSPKTEEAPASAGTDMAAPAMVDSMAATMTDSAHKMMDTTMKKLDSAATAAAKKTM